MQFRSFITSDENICRVDDQVQVLGVDCYTGLYCAAQIFYQKRREHLPCRRPDPGIGCCQLYRFALSCNLGILLEATRTSAVSTSRSRYWVLLVTHSHPFMQFRYFIRSYENICCVDDQVQVLGVDLYWGYTFKQFTSLMLCSRDVFRALTNQLILLFDARSSSNVMGETGPNTRSVTKQHIHPIITVFLYLVSLNGKK